MGAKVVLRLSIAVFAVAAASPALAQEGGETGGVIVGVAVDSIYGAPLRGAIIRVGETGSSGISDNAGRFRITGVPRGSHRVQVVHPLLDTLRLALRTTPRDFGDSTDPVGRDGRSREVPGRGSVDRVGDGGGIRDRRGY